MEHVGPVAVNSASVPGSRDGASPQAFTYLPVCQLYGIKRCDIFLVAALFAH
jgi:hypothetical protein